MMKRVCWCAALLAVLACSSDKDEANSNDGDAPAERYVYNETTAPMVDLPADQSEWSNLIPPLAQTGEDNGDNNAIYSAAMGGYYFLRVQLKDGSYNYEFDPEANEWIWEDVIHRQVGPAYAQILLYKALGREEFRLSADWAFQYAAPRLEEKSNGSLMLHGVGGSALFIMGLTHYTMYTGDDKWAGTALKLGQYLLSKQTSDGNFSSGSPLAHGQIIQALGHLYKMTADIKWLTALETALKYKWENLADISEGTRPYFAVYVNETMADLYRIKPEKWVKDFAYNLADYNVSDQYTEADTSNPLYVGGSYKLDDSTPSWSGCLRMEPVADAYRLALYAGDTDKAEVYKKSLQLGVQFQKKIQWRKGDTDDFEQPELIIGAYPYFHHKPLTRSDFSWHASAMFLKAATVLDLADFPGNPVTSGQEDKPWPVRYRYTESTEPVGVMPSDESKWAELVPPIEQKGEDNGDDNAIYSAALGGYYFLRVQLEDGSYNYEYSPKDDEWFWEDVIHRQVGPAYAQLLVYQALKRDEFRVSADLAFQYAAPRLEEKPEDSLRLSDLGATSLFIMGLTHYSMLTGHDKWDETYLKLGKYLLINQKENGKFDTGSPLVQGQIIQALGHLYKATKDEKWLTALEKGLKYQWDNINDITVGMLPYFAVYVNETLADLYAIKPQEWVKEFAYYSADKNVADQWTAKDTEKALYVGGFYKLDDDPPSWSACLRLEGIADAYRLAVLAGDTERAAIYKKSLLMGVEFQKKIQWRKGDTEGYAQPGLIIGAYPYYHHKTLTRSDFAWHASAMFLKAATYLDLADFPGNPNTSGGEK